MANTLFDKSEELHIKIHEKYCKYAELLDKLAFNDDLYNAAYEILCTDCPAAELLGLIQRADAADIEVE